MSLDKHRKMMAGAYLSPQPQLVHVWWPPIRVNLMMMLHWSSFRNCWSQFFVKPHRWLVYVQSFILPGFCLEQRCFTDLLVSKQSKATFGNTKFVELSTGDSAASSK
ncbi:unnamed protein product [Symbiodinium necroappetens]|uniref:Uncharacterized protein n=1 Tax=Symbiodinium necroappetens TaxID=1628268 RepID=A0A812PYQ4_9DINO|nr:unnamed protein product [Symbiodinium necroappetens]